MPAITFNPKVTQVEEAVVVTPVETQLSVVEPTQLAVVERPSRNIFAESNIDASDLKIPRINLVQKVGNLCDKFPPGSFVFQQEVVLAKPGEQFAAVVLNIDKFFQEQVVYGSGEYGRKVRTKEEVEELGGTTTFGVVGKPYFPQGADITLCVKAPENISDEGETSFPFEFEGENYALAIYTVTKSSYTSLAKEIFTDRVYALKGGLHLGEYRIKSELARNAANSWYLPVPTRPKKYNNPAKAEFFAELMAL